MDELSEIEVDLEHAGELRKIPAAIFGEVVNAGDPAPTGGVRLFFGRGPRGRGKRPRRRRLARR